MVRGICTFLKRIDPIMWEVDKVKMQWWFTGEPNSANNSTVNCTLNGLQLCVDPNYHRNQVIKNPVHLLPFIDPIAFEVDGNR